MKRGKLFTMSGPSGVGKGTIVRELMKVCPNLRLSISCTTRGPRNGEIEGVHYFFVTKERFNEMVAAGDMLEWANVHTDTYGTPRFYVEQMLSEGKDVLLEIDVQGSLKVMEMLPDTVGIFILPPNREELVRRLTGRNSEDKKKQETRIRNAEWELHQAEKYHYSIVNANLNEAVRQVRSVIEAEHLRDQTEALQKLYKEFEEAQAK